MLSLVVLKGNPLGPGEVFRRRRLEDVLPRRFSLLLISEEFNMEFLKLVAACKGSSSGRKENRYLFEMDDLIVIGLT